MLRAIYQELVIHKEIDESLPKMNEVINATKAKPLNWNGELLKIPNQSIESYTEQQNALLILNKSVERYMSNFQHLITNIGICGGPGCGKTFLSMVCCFYAMTKGLNVCTTALLANRAQALGGKHLHQLFCLMGCDCLSPFKNAERALRRILRKPSVMYFLQTLDMLLLDEFLQNNSAMFSCLDIIMRFVRDSELPFGGIF